MCDHKGEKANRWVMWLWKKTVLIDWWLVGLYIEKTQMTRSIWRGECDPQKKERQIFGPVEGKKLQINMQWLALNESKLPTYLPWEQQRNKSKAGRLRNFFRGFWYYEPSYIKHQILFHLGKYKKLISCNTEGLLSVVGGMVQVLTLHVSPSPLRSEKLYLGHHADLKCQL